MKKEKILVILTGGTIDSYYNWIKDTAEPLEKSSLPNYFASMKLYDEFEFVEVCMKDSRSINGEDRATILDALSSSSCSKVIITHGTYTMPDTARFIKANLDRKDQTIILTGSMIPLTWFSPSDAWFNLWYALAHLKFTDPGIYVAMNWRLFDPEDVVKQLNEGRFTSVLWWK